MIRLITLCLLATLTTSSLLAQVLTKRIVMVNGGQFGNPAEPVNVQLYDPESGTYAALDSVQTGSAQDVLIDGPYAYVAAQDSIVRYDLTTQTVLAATAFGGVSTNRMALSDAYLLVGNAFLPFGSTDPYPNNLRIFDRETLALVDSVPALSLPVGNLLVIGDTAYLTQNATNQNFADSAGYLVKVDLVSRTVVDTVQVNQNQEDLGPLVLLDSVIYGINGGSNSITTYDLRDGSVRTDPVAVDLQPGTYGARFTLDETGLLYTVIDGAIGSFDLATRSVVQASIVDTVVTGFVLDTVNERFYVTQTDFFSYNGGIIYDENGIRLDTLLVGFAPEVVGAAYNHRPSANNDSATLDLSLAASLRVAILANDQDPDARRPLTVAIITPGLQGTVALAGDTLVYDPFAGLGGLDSVQYVLTDEWGDRDTAWVLIEVQTGTGLPMPTETVMSLFPNPATEQITLQFAYPWSGTVTCYDLQGRRMLAQPIFQQQRAYLSVEALPAGHYLLRGQGEGQAWQQLLIKH
jgi:hypothetical protein